MPTIVWSKFVGRDAEIEALNRALEQAGKGQGRVVTAVGEDGVGKSRLVYEFVHSHRTQGWLVLESASVSYSKATPYFPVIDLLKRYVHVEDGDDPRTVRAKVTGQILTLDESLQGIISPLLSLLDALPEDSAFLQLDPPQLRLDSLPPESADVFLEALLGDDPSLEPLKRLLIERTEGNPFFLEESVRTLVETQVLAGEPGAYRMVQDLPTIHVPSTVQAVLSARIDRLPQEEKNLLQTSSVIGTEVPFTLLQTIAEIPDETLHPCLRHLQATEFLYETGLFPERIYTFKHALTHEVAYGSLLQESRRLLHAQIVESLEVLAGDRIDDRIERLAHHALRGEVWDKALMYFRQAGNKAMEQSAYQGAVVRFEQALEALSHLSQNRDRQEQAIDVRLSLRGAYQILDA